MQRLVRTIRVAGLLSVIASSAHALPETCKVALRTISILTVDKGATEIIESAPPR
jgi:hypothetical protein